MANKTFKSIRRLSDPELEGLFTNHAATLRGLVDWASKHEGYIRVGRKAYLRRWKIWAWRVWAAGVTVAVAHLLGVW